MIQKSVQEELYSYMMNSDKHKPKLSKYAQRFYEQIHIAFKTYRDFPEMNHCINAMGDLFLMKYNKKYSRAHRKFVLQESVKYFQEDTILEKSIVKSYMQRMCLEGLRDASKIENLALRAKTRKEYLVLMKDLFEIDKDDDLVVNKEDLGNKVYYTIVSINGTNKVLDFDKTELSEIEKLNLKRTIFLEANEESIKDFLNPYHAAEKSKELAINH